MAQQTPRTNSCPTLETWYAYVDGSLEASERAPLGDHLRQCDRCFTLVASIKRAVEAPEPEDEIDRTPEPLRKQAERIGAASKPSPYRWLAYAAAAVLVLGLGLQTIFRSARKPPPLSEAAFTQLAFLDVEMQKRGLAWSDMMAERTRSLPSVPAITFETSPAARAAISIGSALILLKVQLEYANDRDEARHQLDIIKSALDPYAPDDALERDIETFASKLASENGHPDLQRLHRNIIRLIQRQGREIEPYFYLGQWLQSVQIAGTTAAFLSVPFTSLVNVDQDTRQFVAQLQDIPAPEGLITTLTRLTSTLNREGSQPEQTREILSRIDNLLNVLTSP